MKSIMRVGSMLLLLCTATFAEEGYEHLVNVSLMGGFIDFEGDEAVEDAGTLSLHLGLDCTEAWTVEAVLTSIPQLDERFAHSYGDRISRLQSAAGEGVDETSAIGLAVDGLYHFTRWDRMDPYLSIGLGVLHYADDFDNQTEPVLRAGGGLLYHLSDCFALRADLRVVCAGMDTEINGLTSVGVVWTFAKKVTASSALMTLDTDGDGLTDDEEAEVGTNAREVDSDFDGLSDGDEVKTYKTNPMLRDTDSGSVADGHEVIEDGTDPLTEGDDLTCFELNMQFEGDGWEIRPEYFSDLDAIAANLRDDLGATARIEGHTDSVEASSKWKRKRLTRRRAESIADYLKQTWKIDGQRIDAVGYGADRPKAANDARRGNPVNRRMEIYIRKSGS